MINNIIFDFDGVLVDSEILAGRAFSRYLAKFNIKLSEREFIRTYAGIKLVKVMSDISSRFNIKDQDAFFENVMTLNQRIYMNELTAVKGVYNFLNVINQKKLIGSNSNKQRIIDGLIKLNLIKYFNEKDIFSFDMVNIAKPNPAIYLKAIKVSGINPTETIIIEDSVVGVKAGIAANIKVIGLTSGGHWVGRSQQILLNAGAYAVANDFNEMLEIISEL